MKKSILEVVRESVKDLYNAGLIEEATMHEFNEILNKKRKAGPGTKKTSCPRNSPDTNR